MVQESKKTLVIGASSKPERYSNAAVKLLREEGHPVIALGKRAGFIDDTPIQTAWPEGEQIHTVTLYVGSRHQPEYYNPLLQLKPKRVIFNPGTFNDELKRLLKSEGVETVEACTLIMLRSDSY